MISLVIFTIKANSPFVSCDAYIVYFGRPSGTGLSKVLRAQCLVPQTCGMAWASSLIPLTMTTRETTPISWPWSMTAPKTTTMRSENPFLYFY